MMTLSDIRTTKVCNTCRVDHPLSEYTIRRASPDGLCRKCRACCKVYADTRTTRQHRAGDLRYKYGISIEEFEEMLAAQGGACASCGTTEPGGKGSFHVDHDHSCCPGQKSCGKCIRGLLCGRCNPMIGFALDDPDRLRMGADYLESRR